MVDTLHPPPEVIASWPKPNYVDPQTQGPALEYICIIFSSLSIVIVAARLYSRFFITRAPGWDDFFVALSLVFGIALSVLVTIGNKTYHSGRHVWDIPPATFVPHRLNVWISQWCIVLSLTWVKVSVLLFYRRLSVKFSRAFFIATWVGIVYNVLYLLAFCLALILICRPLSAYWNSFNPTWAATHRYSCVREGSAIPAANALSVLGDFYSTLLPLMLIYNLELPLRQKMALYGLFALGFLACAIGIVRLVLLNKLLNQDYDFTWILWEMWIWGILEIYLAIFAASAPALKPFFRRFFIDTIGSLAKYSKRREGTGGTSAGYREDAGPLASNPPKNAPMVDVERIGVAYGGSEPGAFRETGFLQDMEHDGTRHFRLRASGDGKMIPMQVYKPSPPEFAAGSDYSGTISSADDWPIPPDPNIPGSNYLPRGSSLASQQTIQVGLQVDHGSRSSAAGRGGSVAAARRRAEKSRSRTREQGLALNPRSFEDMHDGLGAGSRLESPSDSDEALSISHDEKPPWNTIKTSSSGLTIRDRSDSDSIHLPRMGSRDFGLDRRKT